jgi:hypothetical protein
LTVLPSHSNHSFGRGPSNRTGSSGALTVVHPSSPWPVRSPRPAYRAARKAAPTRHRSHGRDAAPPRLCVSWRRRDSGSADQPCRDSATARTRSCHMAASGRENTSLAPCRRLTQLSLPAWLRVAKPPPIHRVHRRIARGALLRRAQQVLGSRLHRPSQGAPEIAFQAAATVQQHLEGSSTARDASQSLPRHRDVAVYAAPSCYGESPAAELRRFLAMR